MLILNRFNNMDKDKETIHPEFYHLEMTSVTSRKISPDISLYVYTEGKRKRAK